MLLDKKKALYVKCCIIPNGVMDSQGDILYSEDIKRIFTSFNNQDNFEIYHNDIPIPEVSLLENYISSADETIGTAVVPSGSWNAVIRVDNPEIQAGLLVGEFKGVSLNNRIKDQCKKNLHGTVRYKDVGDAECIIPLLISFVEAGANGYGLHVMDYEAYIQKSKTVIIKDKGENSMNFKEFIDGIKSLINQAEVPEEEPSVEKEEENPEEEKVEETVEETIEEEKVEEPTVEKEEENPEEEKVEEKVEEEKVEETVEETIEEEKVEEPTVEKEEETPVEETTEVVEVAEEETPIEETIEKDGLEFRIEKLENIVTDLVSLMSDNSEEETVEETIEEEQSVDEDTPKITKSEKVIIEDKTVKQNNYYEMTGRDPITGMKIRK